MDPINPWIVQSLQDFRFYCCPVCEIKEFSEEKFVKHVFKIHQNSFKYIQPFVTSNEFLDDTEKVSSETVSKEECPECHKMFDTSYLLTHMRCFHGKYETKQYNPLKIKGEKFSKNVETRTINSLCHITINMNQSRQGGEPFPRTEVLGVTRPLMVH